MKRAPISFAAAVLALGGMWGLDFGSVPPDERREPTVPTNAELEWMAGLNPHRRRDWQRRFKQGLTAEQRRYVDEQLQSEEVREP